MKKILSIVLVLSMMLVACAFGVAEEAKTICHIMPDASEFFVTVNDGLKAKAEEAGYNYVDARFDVDYAKLITIVENMVQSGVDIIVCNPLTASGDDAFKIALENGVAVLLYGNAGQQYTTFLTADEYIVGSNIGAMAGDWAQKTYGGELKVAFIQATKSESTMARSTGMVDAFKEKCPNAEIVGYGEFYEIGDATAAMETLLQKNPEIQCVVALNDQSAIESAEAMKAAGKSTEEYAVFGCDGGAEGLKMISSGDVYRGTVAWCDIVTDIFNTAVQVMAGELSDGTVIALTCEPVTPENVADYL